MNQTTGRRRFLQLASTAPFLAAPALAAAKGPSETVVLGILGMGGRGNEHLKFLAGIPGVEVAYVCDVDERRAGKAADDGGRDGKKTPKAVGDLRRVLDDKAVDAVIVATCNHWHAPAAILACTAGKHVYVEKPCSHNPREGELLVEAARKHGRVVQMGNQRRSWPTIIEAIEQVRGGAIGRAYFAECYYGNTRGSIGHGREMAAPSWLDFELWQGPAARRPYRDNILHYNWHWFWNWGNGELGNNGVHMIDVARWGLGVDYPTRVSSSGGRYRYQDDQETPDTHVVSYEFDDRKAITWEGRSCNPVRPGGSKADVVFYGDTGCARDRRRQLHDHRHQGEGGQEDLRQGERHRRPPRRTSWRRPAASRSRIARSPRGTGAPCSATWATSPTGPAAPSAATRRTAASSTTPRP